MMNRGQISHDPSDRVHGGGGGAESLERFYAQMSSDLVAMHGALVKAEYFSHYPDFEIRFHYKDGSQVVSGRRTGRHDIHFLSLGYAGEGPRYAKVFLDAAGCNRTATEIEKIRPGDVIVPGDSSVGRFQDASISQVSSAAQQLTVVSLGVISEIHPESGIAISPDQDTLVLISTTEGGSASLQLVRVRDNSTVWRKPLSTYAPMDEIHTYAAPGFGVGFLSENRILVVGYTESSKESTILLINSTDGSLVSKLTALGKMTNYFTTNYSWVSPKHGTAILTQRGGPLIVSVAEDNLGINRCKPSHLDGNSVFAIGIDGSMYIVKSPKLFSYDPKSNGFVEVARGANSVCAHEDGTIICGGGYDDGSGDCYMSVYDPASGEGKTLDFQRNTVFEVKSAGSGRILLCYGNGPSRSRNIGLFSLKNMSRLWQKQLQKDQYSGAIIAVDPDKGWVLVQGDGAISLISMADSRTLWSTPRVAGERIHGICVAKHQRVYLCRYAGDEYEAKFGSGAKERGTLDCWEVGLSPTSSS